jgi:uncharacterized membrane protein YbhN (UPF0104 family)
VAVFALATFVLYRELKKHSWAEITAAVSALPPSRLALAAGLTALDYLIMSGYDGLAVWYLGRSLKPSRVMLASFIGYAMSHNFTWALGGTTARLRLYTAWGFSAVEVVKIFALIGLTFLAGYCAIAGIVFLVNPLTLPPELSLPLASTFWLGPVLLGLFAIYLIACGWSRPITLGKWRLEFPPLRLAAMQATVATCDLLLLSAVMYVLLPPDTDISYWQFANVMLLAVVAVLFSHVPAGVAVLEVIVLHLVPHPNSAALFGSLLAFRAIFYLSPLLIAVTLLGIHELLEHFKGNSPTA